MAGVKCIQDDYIAGLYIRHIVKQSLVSVVYITSKYWNTQNYVSAHVPMPATHTVPSASASSIRSTDMALPFYYFD